MEILLLLGSLALCLYGMKVMSQGILKLAGSRMRASLRRISNRRFHSFWTGTWITAFIQSSSAVTLMAVSLVNAGLLTLGQSIALMMGANVGTTVTAWIIALLCFQSCSFDIAFAFIALSVPFMFVTSGRFRVLGECLIGFGLFLCGVIFFGQYTPSPAAFPAVPNPVELFTAWGFWGVLLCFAVGIIITFVFRSSAATILLAMALLIHEWLLFPQAAALVIGDNVGTTLTAVFASRRANNSARRAAFSHLFFNLFGVLWALPLVYPLSEGVWQLITLGGGFPSSGALALGLAFFHTLFNLISAMLLVGFIPQFKKLLARCLPVVEGDEDEFHLHFIQGGLLSTAELSVEEARKETALFGIRCQKMLQLTTQFLRMVPEHPQYSSTFSRIEKYEKITDRLELEIVRYLSHIDRSAMSDHMVARVRALYRMVDELESIGDACYKLARTIIRRNEHRIRFIPMQQQNVDRMVQLTQDAIDQMVKLLQKPELTSVDIQRAYNQEDAINSQRGLLREQNILSVQSGYYSYQSGTFYMDIVNSCEKLADYIINVLEAHDEQSRFDEE